MGHAYIICVLFEPVTLEWSIWSNYVCDFDRQPLNNSFNWETIVRWNLNCMWYTCVCEYLVYQRVLYDTIVKNPRHKKKNYRHARDIETLETQTFQTRHRHFRHDIDILDKNNFLDRRDSIRDKLPDTVISVSNNILDRRDWMKEYCLSVQFYCTINIGWVRTDSQ